MPSFPTTPALRSHLENQVGFYTELTQKSFDALQRLGQINLRLGQHLMQDAIDANRALLGCATPFEFGPTALRQAAPVSQHLREYQAALLHLMTGTQTDMARTAETRMPEQSRSAAAMAEEFARHATEAGEAFMTRH